MLPSSLESFAVAHNDRDRIFDGGTEVLIGIVNLRPVGRGIPIKNCPTLEKYVVSVSFHSASRDIHSVARSVAKSSEIGAGHDSLGAIHPPSPGSPAACYEEDPPSLRSFGVTRWRFVQPRFETDPGSSGVVSPPRKETSSLGAGRLH